MNYIATKQDDSNSGEDKQVQEAPETQPADTRPSEAPDRIGELEKKLGEVTKTIADQNEFIQGASVVINTLAYDPELRTAFQNKLKGMVGQGNESGVQQAQTSPAQNSSSAPASQTQTNSAADQKLNNIEAAQRDDTIYRFEKEYGIESLPDEDKKEARRKIETYLNDFGWSVGSIPLPRLRANLEKAFVGTHAEKLREEGKLEGILAARTNGMAAMPTLSGNTTSQSPQTADLTSKQKEWIDKFGVDADKAKKTYFSKEEEYKRPSKAETKKEE